MDVRLLIIAWFSTCMCLRFNQIWSVLGSSLLGSSLNILDVLYFFGIWYVLFRLLFLSFKVFNMFFFCCFQVKSWFFVRFMVELKISGPPNCINPVGSFWVKDLRHCLVFHIFVKGFFLFNGVSDKHPLSLFWIVLFQEKTGFCQTKSKKVIFFSCIWTEILKLFEHLFQKNK